MDKKVFDSLARGLEQAAGYKRGKEGFHAYTLRIRIPNVKEIRRKTGLTQEQFSGMFGWSKDTVSSWEQNRRAPDHSARVLLKLIDADPDYVLDVMRA